MAASRTFLTDSQFSERERQIVIKYDQFIRRGLESGENRTECAATFVHVGLRHHQSCGLACQLNLAGNQSRPASLPDPNAMIGGNPLDNAKADIVICAGVF